MEALLIYSLGLWFFYFLLNYAEITKSPSTGLKRWMGPKWGYPLSCAFCAAWWATLASWGIGLVPAYYLLTAPVIHLFIDQLFSKLSDTP